MNQRTFGRTGMTVSEIGYGAWGIGQSMWLGAHDDESLDALNRAVDLGVTMIDTALAYGNGHSEELVGRVVRERSDEIVVATKIPPKNMTWPAPSGIDPDEAFPADYVRACTERSLRNLGLDTIDVQQFHVWSDDWVGRGSWLDGIEALKSEGKIRAFGVSINDHQPANALKLIESGDVDSVQVIYNVFDQSPEDELLPACEQHGIGVLARVPFDEGSLTGRIGPDTEFPDGDFRNRYFRGDRKQQVAERVQAILDELGIERDQLPELALRYILSHPAVSTVIPGMRTVRNVERNAAVGDGRGLPAEQVATLKRHRWERDFYR
ncbi:MAG TPA: aldo/keto reductase [Solirubrobacteraceae bacterium]|nr:aldo/keto reductase [Solirubrobacteraceae bacterium]